MLRTVPLALALTPCSIPAIASPPSPRLASLDSASSMAPGFTLASVVLCLSSLSFLFLTGCSDPGIVRPGSRLAEDVAGSYGRFCHVCQVCQPRGTFHCEDCGVCIEELDHHCPWMGKCVGKKNMKWFQAFNMSWIVYLIFVLVVTFSDAAQEAGAGED